MVRVDGRGIKWIGFLMALDEIYESQKSSKYFREGQSSSASAEGHSWVGLISAINDPPRECHS